MVDKMLAGHRVFALPDPDGCRISDAVQQRQGGACLARVFFIAQGGKTGAAGGVEPVGVDQMTIGEKNFVGRQVGHVNGRFYTVEDGEKGLECVSQIFFRLLPLSYVESGEGDSFVQIFGVDRCRGHQDVDDGPILALPPRFDHAGSPAGYLAILF